MHLICLEERVAASSFPLDLLLFIRLEEQVGGGGGGGCFRFSASAAAVASAVAGGAVVLLFFRPRDLFFRPRDLFFPPIVERRGMISLFFLLTSNQGNKKVIYIS